MYNRLLISDDISKCYQIIQEEKWPEKGFKHIDLWTKDMLIDDMKQFFHQTLISMANTFERATNEDKIVGDMKDFCDYFAEKMGLKEE